MKSLVPLLFFCLTASSLSFGSPPKTEEEFVSQVRAALSTKNTAAMDALTYKEGMTEDDKAMAARIQKMMMEIPSEIEDVALRPLPKDFQSVAILRGKKMEMTGPPVGVIDVTYKSGASGSQSTSTPYTVVDSVYYLVGSKSTDLDWKGPPDKNIGFMVTGQGQDHVNIHVQWNASGVTQTRQFSQPSITFWGQHIDSIHVESHSDDTNVTMTVLEAGETIHTSEPLVGKGTIKYQRKGL